jgi:SAM-dependent methyltransferase
MTVSGLMERPRTGHALQHEKSETGRRGDAGRRMPRTELLACPHCSGSLVGSTSLTCESCSRRFPVVDGIPCFAESEAFYDDYASVHCPFAANPQGLKGALLRVLPFWSWREWKFWSRVIPRCDHLLEFGCGRGREIFMDRATETTGYDGSLAFLRDCRYSNVALGQIPRLPFRSAQFDVVASSHTIGHVALDHKDELISEIARVLKPGGVTAHIIETDSDHPAVRSAKTHPDAYRKQFIDQHGHIGLEHAGRAIDRFTRQGFTLTTCRLVDAIVPSVMNYRRFFGVPELADLPELAWSRRFSRWTGASSVANAAYEVGFGAFHNTAEQWMGNPRFAQFILVAFTKNGQRS